MKNRLTILLLTLCLALCGCNLITGNEQPENTVTEEPENTQAAVPHISHFENITVLDEVSAQKLLDIYNTYANFGVCEMSFGAVMGDTRDRVLRLSGCPEAAYDSYVVKEVPCCHKYEEILVHIQHYIGTNLIVGITGVENKPVMYEGKMYALIGAMGYGGYYMLGELSHSGDGSASVTVRYDYEAQDQTAYFTLLDGTWRLTNIE